MSDGTLNFPERNSSPDSPSTGRHKIWISSTDGKPKVTDSDGNTVGFEAIYGSQWQYNNRDTSQTNNTTTYQTFLNTNLQDIDFENGYYRLDITFVWGISTASSSFRAKLLLNGDQKGRVFQKETKDPTDESIETMFTVIEPGELTQAGVQAELQFAVESAGNTATMYSAMLILTRTA